MNAGCFLIRKQLILPVILTIVNNNKEKVGLYDKGIFFFKVTAQGITGIAVIYDDS